MGKDSPTEVENDPIMKEIPVFFFKILAEKLIIVQYPMHIKDSCTNAIFSRTSINPENQKIRIEFAMNTTNEHTYDHNMGKQLALNTDRKSKENDEVVFESCLMDKAVLTLKQTFSNCSNFAVGIF